MPTRTKSGSSSKRGSRLRKSPTSITMCAGSSSSSSLLTWSSKLRTTRLVTIWIKPKYSIKPVSGSSSDSWTPKSRTGWYSHAIILTSTASSQPIFTGNSSKTPPSKGFWRTSLTTTTQRRRPIFRSRRWRSRSSRSTSRKSSSKEETDKKCWIN